MGERRARSTEAPTLRQRDVGESLFFFWLELTGRAIDMLPDILCKKRKKKTTLDRTLRLLMEQKAFSFPQNAPQSETAPITRSSLLKNRILIEE